MPTNINAIAVTETRGVVNNIRKEYTAKVLTENPEFDSIKSWKHNDSMSKEGRLGHDKIDGQKRDFGEKFAIPVYRQIKGVWKFMGQVFADHPHDPALPASEVIGCNCEAVYRMVRRK